MSTAEFTISDATLTDLPAIADLAGRIWRAHYPGIISPEQVEYMLARMYAVETLREEIRSLGIRYCLLRMDGRMTGFASLGPTDQPGVMKLHKLYLLPDLHGRGWGSRLLHHCEREAREVGAHRLILTVNKRNAKAIATYQRNGFAIVESVTNDIGGGFVMADFIMAKELAATALFNHETRELRKMETGS